MAAIEHNKGEIVEEIPSPEARTEHKEESDEFLDSPIEQVREIVPTKDDPNLPSITIRTWLIGPIINMVMAGFLQLFSYRNNQILVTKSLCTIVILLIGNLMASKIPKKRIKIPGTKYAFSTNPGPFNIKEHVLLSILATAGFASPPSLPILTLMRVYLHKNISFLPFYLLVQTSQIIGFGIAGLFIRYLVEPPHMWFPYCLLEVSFFRSLHVKEKRSKGGLSTVQFMIICAVCIFSVSLFINYFTTSLLTFSVVCVIWKKSRVAQIIGSGAQGFGIGSISLDWRSIRQIGSPVAFTRVAIVNKFVGFIAAMYLLAPVAVFFNIYKSQSLPFFSANIYDSKGNIYDAIKVFNSDPHSFKGSTINLSIFNLIGMGFGLAAVISAVVHFGIYHRKEVWAAKGEKYQDIHNKLMRKYKLVPQRLFKIMILIATITCLVSSKIYMKELEIPFLGIILAIIIPATLLLPLGIIEATSGMSIQTHLLSQIILGYAYPGKPVATLVLTSVFQTVKLLSLSCIINLKLGHYLKIPPRSMFFIQVVGTVIGYSTRTITAWLALSRIRHICEDHLWTCPSDKGAFTRSLLWGIDPSQVFMPHGHYRALFLFFLLGLLMPILIWFMSRKWPEKRWLKKINVPIFFSGPSKMPPVGAAHVWAFFILSFISFWFFFKRKGWWNKYAYSMSNGLDLGVATLNLMFTFLKDAFEVEWEETDNCQLA